MSTSIKNLFRLLLALAISVGGLAFTGSIVLAAPVPIELCALSGDATLTGAVTVPIWGFGIPTTPGDCSTATASLPGPVLEVNLGDVVTVTVINDLPGGHTASFELPGLLITSPGVDQYQFTASRVGTFTYQSPGDSGRQMAMGLYGALVVRPLGEPAGFSSEQCSTAAGSAYGNAFDQECLLVLSQVDPNFNADPDGFNMHDYLATYWMINGKAYPDTTPIAATVGSNVLLRYVNAGYDSTTMALIGMHEKVIARDAFALNNPFLASAETIPAGATEDTIVVIPSYTPPSANGFVLYNRQLHVTNGAPGVSPGGMLAFIMPE